jgi:hypothetical protein
MMSEDWASLARREVGEKFRQLWCEDDLMDNLSNASSRWLATHFPSLMKRCAIYTFSAHAAHLEAQKTAGARTSTPASPRRVPTCLVVCKVYRPIRALEIVILAPSGSSKLAMCLCSSGVSCFPSPLLRNGFVHPGHHDVPTGK